jgi:hypothetical protein
VAAEVSDWVSPPPPGLAPPTFTSGSRAFGVHWCLHIPSSPAPPAPSLTSHVLRTDYWLHLNSPTDHTWSNFSREAPPWATPLCTPTAQQLSLPSAWRLTGAHRWRAQGTLSSTLRWEPGDTLETVDHPGWGCACLTSDTQAPGTLVPVCERQGRGAAAHTGIPRLRAPVSLPPLPRTYHFTFPMLTTGMDL